MLEVKVSFYSVSMQTWNIFSIAFLKIVYYFNYCNEDGWIFLSNSVRSITALKFMTFCSTIKSQPISNASTLPWLLKRTILSSLIQNCSAK